MTASVRLITFDLDDTLWDVKPALVAADAAQWQYLTARFPNVALRELAEQQAATLRAEILADQPTLAHHISQFREVFLNRLLLCSGQSETIAAEAASEAFAAFYAERHKVVLFEDATTALSSLSQDYLLGALTNGNADVRKTPIARYFSYAWRAEEFGISKPDPLLFHRVFEQAGVAASEVIHVGDCHNNDVAGAVAAGARAVWFSPDGGNSDIANAVVTRLADLPSVIEALVSTKPD